MLAAAGEGENQLQGASRMTAISLTVNGKTINAEVEPNTLLVDLLRKHLSLTGTHVGCDTAQCGACVVHLNGDSVKACNTFAVQAHGAKVTTIEGLSAGKDLHPVQAAFREAHGLQCGFCTPGMVMAAADLLAKNPNPSEAEIRSGLKGNICRCTGYHNIVKAVQIAAKAMQGGARVAAE
jgi:carbon-monoxide dehydrogenase small subunit